MVDENGNEQGSDYPNEQNSFKPPMDRYGTSIIKLTDPSPEVRQLYLSLKGLEEQKDGQLNQMGDPLLNDIGVQSVLSQVRSIVSRINILSNYQQAEFEALVIDQMLWCLDKDLMLNAKRYAITDPAGRDKISSMAVDTAYACAKRGVDGDDKRFWSKQSQEITMNQTNTQKGNQGFLQKMNPWANKQ
jgi:hypothetical protein